MLVGVNPSILSRLNDLLELGYAPIKDGYVSINYFQATVDDFPFIPAWVRRSLTRQRYSILLDVKKEIGHSELSQLGKTIAKTIAYWTIRSYRSKMCGRRNLREYDVLSSISRNEGNPNRNG